MQKLSDRQHGILSRLVESGKVLKVDDLVAQTEVEVQQLRLPTSAQQVRQVADSLVRRGLVRKTKTGYKATAGARRLIVEM